MLASVFNLTLRDIFYVTANNHINSFNLLELTLDHCELFSIFVVASKEAPTVSHWNLAPRSNEWANLESLRYGHNFLSFLEVEDLQKEILGRDHKREHVFACLLHRELLMESTSWAISHMKPSLFAKVGGQCPTLCTPVVLPCWLRFSHDTIILVFDSWSLSPCFFKAKIGSIT